jgi:predicted RNA binding protein YcfA (HicA-like mRNA interferase family)
MKPIAVRRLRRILARLGCVEVRQLGSHLMVRCGTCQATIPTHSGDVAPGTLRQIERALAPALGDGWLERER